MKTAKKLLAIILIGIMLMGTFSAGASANEPEDKQMISSVSVSFNNRIAGLKVNDFEKFITINTNGVSFDYEHFSPIIAYSIGGYISLSPDTELVEGKTYSFNIYFAADKGYGFADDTAVTVNGETTPIVDRLTDEYFVITVTTTIESRSVFDKILTAISSLFVFKTIKRVSVDLNTDLAGKDISDDVFLDYVKINTNNVSFDEEYAVSFSSDDDLVFDTFEDGCRYTANIYMYSKNGYTFVDASKLSVAVNGTSAYGVDVNSANYTQACFSIDFTVGKGIDKVNIIKNINIEVDEDVVGKTIDSFKESVCLTTDLAEINYDYMPVYNITDDKSVNDSYVLESGKVYSVSFAIITTDNSKFSGNTSVKLNGVRIDPSLILLDSDYMLYTLYFSAGGKIPNPEFTINKLNITGPTVTEGMTAGEFMHSISFNNDDVELDWVDDVYCSGLHVNSSDVLVDGETYTAVIGLHAKGGKCFTANGDYTYNGKKVSSFDFYARDPSLLYVVFDFTVGETPAAGGFVDFIRGIFEAIANAIGSIIAH